MSSGRTNIPFIGLHHLKSFIEKSYKIVDFHLAFSNILTAIIPLPTLSSFLLSHSLPHLNLPIFLHPCILPVFHYSILRIFILSLWKSLSCLNKSHKMTCIQKLRCHKHCSLGPQARTWPSVMPLKMALEKSEPWQSRDTSIENSHSQRNLFETYMSLF